MPPMVTESGPEAAALPEGMAVGAEETMLADPGIVVDGLEEELSPWEFLVATARWAEWASSMERLAILPPG